MGADITNFIDSKLKYMFYFLEFHIQFQTNTRGEGTEGGGMGNECLNCSVACIVSIVVVIKIESV